MSAVTLQPTFVPKIIHQTWKTQSVPLALREYAESCKKANPDYAYRLYTDQDLRDVIVRSFPQYLMAYDAFERNIERVDFARYAIMHSIGGVYADLDMQCFYSFDKYLAHQSPVFGNEPIEHRDRLYQGRQYVICNALMISPPGQEVWIKIMDFIVSHYVAGQDPVYNTGPMALTKLYESDKTAFAGCIILPSCDFYAQSDHMTNKTQQGILYVTRECNLDSAPPAAVHRWAHTWIPMSRTDHTDDEWQSKRSKLVNTALLVVFVAAVTVAVDRLVLASVHHRNLQRS